MEILICQTCGAILKSTGKTCNACGAFISSFSPTALPVMSGTGAPLVVEVKPDLLGLERVVSKRQMTILLERGEGNGNGNGHGSSDNGQQQSSIDIPGGAWIGAAPAAPAAGGNPWDESSTPIPAPPQEPTELSFTPPQPQAPPQPAAEPVSSSFFGGAIANNLAEPAKTPTLVETPDPQPAPGTPAINAALGALQQMQSAPSLGRNDPGGQMDTVRPDVTAPPTNNNGVDFFNSAPPPVSEAPGQGPTMGQTIATAAAGAAVGVAVGVAAAKTFDFFNNAPTAGGTPPAGPLTDATPQDTEYSMGDRSDFFASPPKLSAEAAPQLAPPNQAELAKPSNSQQDLPALGNDARQSDQASSGGFDFFAAAPIVKDSRKSADDLYPDETHLRGKGKETKLDSPSSVSLYADDDDDVKPKIARPRGYTPKEGKDSAGKDAKADKVKGEDDEDASFFKDKPPARRSFSGNDKSPKKKSDSDDGDEDTKPKKSKEGFLAADVNFLGMSMSRQNQIMLISVLGFVGIVFFNMIGTLLGGIQVTPPPKPAATNLPNLSGNWKVRFTQDPSTDGHLMAVLAAQKGLDIQGRGSDEYGQFSIVGTVIPPNRIQLKKKYAGGDDHAKPVLYEGEFVLGSEPLYARGRWSLTHVVGKFLHAQVKQDGGNWEGNFYVNPAPAQTGPIPGPAMAAIDWPWDKWNRWFTGLDFAQKSLMAAISVIGGAIVVLFGSLTIFGPSGKMNIWEKQKYIPSQFNSQHNKMVRELSKPLKAGGLPLGRRKEWRKWWPFVAKDLSITPEIRENDPHLLVLGAGDKGKTRLIAHMISHDIESNDRAVVVIDSDGGLTDLITRWISAHPKAKEIANRVILLDPTYKGNAIGYNPLEMPEDEDLQSAASALVYGFKAIYTEPPGAQSQWNQQTANILRNAALLLMANGKTLTDLPPLLNDNDFRDVLLESIEKRKREKAEYITLLDTWGQYKRLARTDQWINWVEPILNRVGPMLSDSRIRSILTKPVGDIKLRSLIVDKKVLIVKVAKGQLDQNANLLGSLIVTGVKQAALSLANEAAAKQPPVAMYLDEFDNFIEKETIEAITSETDKFKIGFIGCIRTLQHLPEDFRNQLIIAVGTMACFALAKKDGDILGPQMFRVDGRKIKHQTIQNFFNKVNTSPQFELISDEEKLNIDRVVGQEERTFFCYRVGTVAGVFNLKSHDFNDIPDAQVNKKIIDKMHGITTSKAESKKNDSKSDR